MIAEQLGATFGLAASQRRRRNIFVENNRHYFPSSVGAAYLGLISFGAWFYKDSAPNGAIPVSHLRSKRGWQI
jgi:hypothetical protein